VARRTLISTYELFHLQTSGALVLFHSRGSIPVYVVLVLVQERNVFTGCNLTISLGVQELENGNAVTFLISGPYITVIPTDGLFRLATWSHAGFFCSADFPP
jgi:hypothetical protein